MNVSYHYAHTQEELDAIYRLRYEIYVEEMQIFGDVADHQNRMLYDLNDANSRLLYATINGEVIAALRLNLGKDAPFSEELERTYNLNRFRSAIDDSQVLVLTRFMVRPQYRGTSLAHHMICQVAELCLQECIEISVCDCQPHLIRYYQRIGFRSYECDVYNDPEFGIMIPLAFVNGDLDYLKSIRSPMKTIFARRECNTPVVDRCIAALGNSTVQSVRDIPEKDRVNLTNQICEKEALFKDLEKDMVCSIISPGHLMNLAPNDRLIRKGQPAQTMFVLISGYLEMKDGDRVIGKLLPGAIVGELAFLLSGRRTVDIYVGSEGAYLISLDESMLKKKFKSKSSSALLLNLTKILAHKLSTFTTKGSEKFVFPMNRTFCDGFLT